jgi:preprotein translocase subunit SecG
MNLAFGLVLLVHVLLAFFLIAIILLQGGRGGLGEALGGAAAQSLFGGGANTVMTKITAVCAALFMVTCLSLAALSTARGRSVIDRMPITEGELPIPLPQQPGQPPAAPVAAQHEATPSVAPAQDEPPPPSTTAPASP